LNSLFYVFEGFFAGVEMLLISLRRPKLLCFLEQPQCLFISAQGFDTVAKKL